MEKKINLKKTHQNSAVNNYQSIYLQYMYVFWPKIKWSFICLLEDLQ